jgi:dephospho-CoA kinase
MVKIAISGKANSGKNTLADLLGKEIIKQDYFYKEYKIFAFADPIKMMTAIMFPEIEPNWLWGPSEYRSAIVPDKFDRQGKFLTVRRVLTDIGYIGRSYNEDTWINSTLKLIDDYQSQEKIAIISDVRFLNELNTIKREGFFTIRIVRNKPEVITWWDKIKQIFLKKDASECSLDNVTDDKFDFVIDNNFSLDLLKIKVEEVVQKILVL